MNRNPKVSIVSISYNQEKYIGQALESFVMQKTNFEYEIIIADDCSHDKTREIIQSYVKKYPQLFRPILREKNIGVQPNLIDAMRAARGKYIALCEGDDYFTDANKLQKQVEFLDNNPDYALCFHPVRVFFENGEEPDSIYPEFSSKRSFTLTNLLKTNFIQTNSVMYRKQKYVNIPENILPLDWYLHLYHAKFGKIGFISNVMSAYRRHPGGIWWQMTREGNIDEIWKKYGIGHINLYTELLKIFGDTPEYRSIIDNHIAGTISALNRIDNKNKTNFMLTYANSPNEQNNALLLSMSRTVYESQKSIEKLNHSIKILEEKFVSEKSQLESEKSQLESEKSQLESEKVRILGSKAFRLGFLLTSPHRKLKELLKGIGKK